MNHLFHEELSSGIESSHSKHTILFLPGNFGSVRKARDTRAALVGRPTKINEGGIIGSRTEKCEAAPGSSFWLRISNLSLEIRLQGEIRCLPCWVRGRRLWIAAMRGSVSGTECTRQPEHRFRPSVNRPAGLNLNSGPGKNLCWCQISDYRKVWHPAKALPCYPGPAATASLVLLILLVLVPCAVLFFTINPEVVSRPLRFSELPVILLGGLGNVVTVGGLGFVTAIAPLGKPVDPLGPQAVWGMLLGALNIGASLLVVMLRYIALKARRIPGEASR